MPNTMKPSFYIFMIFMVLIFTALGTWQVKRLSWKEDLLRSVEIEKNRDAAAVNLSFEEANSLNRHQIKRGSFKGQFDNTKKPILWRGQILNGAPVFYIVAAYVLDSKEMIPVVIGSLEYEPDKITLPAAPLKITGTLKIHQDNMFRPENNLSQDIFYRMNQKDLKTYWQSDKIAPALFYSDQKIINDAEPIDTILTIPNNHLYYACFWYTLAILITGLTLYRRFRK